MFEIRRGCERMDELLVCDFEKVYDPIYKFECYRKLLARRTKIIELELTG